jgi:hypothetical protein
MNGMLTAIFDAEYDGGSISSSDRDALESKRFSEPPEAVLDFGEEHVSTGDNY